MAHTIQINNTLFTEIADFITWIEMMPKSIKNKIDIEEAEWSLFGEFGYEGVLADKIDEEDLFESSIYDYNHYTELHINVNDGSRELIMTVENIDDEEKIEFKFIPSSLTE